MNSKIYARVTMLFVSIMMFSFTAFSQSTTLEIPVSKSHDDAEEYLDQFKDHRPVGDLDLTSSDLELVFDKEP